MMFESFCLSPSTFLNMRVLLHFILSISALVGLYPTFHLLKQGLVSVLCIFSGVVSQKKFFFGSHGRLGAYPVDLHVEQYPK